MSQKHANNPLPQTAISNSQVVYPSKITDETLLTLSTLPFLCLKSSHQ